TFGGRTDALGRAHRERGGRAGVRRGGARRGRDPRVGWGGGLMASRAQLAFQEMARMDPDLAARLVLMSLPVAARRIPGDLTYDLTVQGWGTDRVAKHNGIATADQQPERPDIDRPHPRLDFQ